MEDADGINFGNADGGDVADVANVGANPGGVAGEPGAADPTSFTKRGRGRPRKSADGSTDATGSAGQQAGKSKSQASKKLDVGLFARQIVGAHQMLAVITKNPIWAIDDKAAEALANALMDVMSHHSINVNPATLAYMKLIGIAAAIYGPKIMVVKMQNDQKKKEAANTIDMPQ